MKWTTSAIVSIAVLMCLSMAVSACDNPTFCGGLCDPDFGPYYVANGESITVSAPTGYSYTWTTYAPHSGGGWTGTTIAGSNYQTTINVPSNAQTGDIYGAVVTMAKDWGTGLPTCQHIECIYLVVDRINMPTLSDFCYKGAIDANANLFKVTLPTGHGWTSYSWSGTGLNSADLSSGVTNTIESSLNNLNVNTYPAKLTIVHGTRSFDVGTDPFQVFALPTGPITMPM
jgi:hypothetical protein